MQSGAVPVWPQPPRGPFLPAPPTLRPFLRPPLNLPPRPPFHLLPPCNGSRFPQSQNFSLTPFASAPQLQGDHQFYNGPPPQKQPCTSGPPGGWNIPQQYPPTFPAGPPNWSNHRPQRQNPRKRQRQAKGTPSLTPPSPGPKPVMFVCSPCHKEYKSKETYETHLATHVKCSHCEFECSKGAMGDHQLVHFLPAELNFSSQEDIEKWREERRKNYPTAENVARKRKLQEEKEERGEVADTPLYRYISRVCGGDGHTPGRRGRHNRWVVGSKRKPFQGRHSDAPHAEMEGNQSQRGGGHQSWRRGWRGRRGGGRGGRRRGRHTPHDKESLSETLQNISSRKPTLLEKLLAAEVRKEQNAILQCIRHIVKEGFFGEGGKTRPLSAERRRVAVGGEEQVWSASGKEGGAGEMEEEKERGEDEDLEKGEEEEKREGRK